MSKNFNLFYHSKQCIKISTPKKSASVHVEIGVVSVPLIWRLFWSSEEPFLRSNRPKIGIFYSKIVIFYQKTTIFDHFFTVFAYFGAHCARAPHHMGGGGGGGVFTLRSTKYKKTFNEKSHNTFIFSISHIYHMLLHFCR